MARRLLSPLEWHLRELDRQKRRGPSGPPGRGDHHDEPLDLCCGCDEARRVCRRKIRYGSFMDADRAVTELNERERYAEPVTRYPCRWCGGWHLAHATTKVAAKRAERARRRWLAKKELDARAFRQGMRAVGAAFDAMAKELAVGFAQALPPIRDFMTELGKLTATPEFQAWYRRHLRMRMWRRKRVGPVAAVYRDVRLRPGIGVGTRGSRLRRRRVVAA